MDDYFVLYARLNELDERLGEGWECPNGNARPLPMIGHHGRYAALVVKKSPGGKPERSSAMDDAESGLTLDDIDDFRFIVERANAVDHAHEQAWPETQIAMRWLQVHGDELIELAREGLAARGT